MLSWMALIQAKVIETKVWVKEGDYEAKSIVLLNRPQRIQKL